MMHICVEGEWDPTNCFALQNMAAITFGWALAKRMECLQDLTCCPKVSDAYFMTSEPDFLVPGEPAPFDWQGFLAGTC